MSIRVPVAILLAVSALTVACAESAEVTVASLPPLAEAPPVQPSVLPTESGVSMADPTSTPTQTPQRPSASPLPGVSTFGLSVDLGSGSPAPPLDLTLLNGGSLRLADLKGKVVVLNFWASWCIPCRKEMPALQAIWQEYQEQGVVFVGVAVNSDREENARAFAEEAGVTYPLGIDTTGQYARDYRVMSLPTTFLIDRQGNETRRLGTANEGVLKIFLRGLLRDP